MNYAELELYSNEWLNTITHEDITNNTFPVIVDRDQLDVNNFMAFIKTAKHCSEWGDDEWNYWDGVIKGIYNADDMNRVSNAVAYLSGRLAAYGYAVETSPVLDRAIGAIPSPEEFDRYLADVEHLRAVLPLLPTTPEVPEDMEWFNHIEANNIEQILKDLDFLITNMALAWYYSGDVECGEI